MKVSTRGDYACRALLSLALHGDGAGPTSVRDIAEIGPTQEGGSCRLALSSEDTQPESEGFFSKVKDFLDGMGTKTGRSSR